MRLAAICVMALGAAQPSFAQIAISYVDSAPTDIFDITNLSPCPSGQMELTIDLTESTAGLVFDTVPQGQGVNVSQPFVLSVGAEYLEGVPIVSDGAAQLTLRIADLPADGRITFTIDVDDTLPQSFNGQTRVSGVEIAGAAVRLSGDAAFGEGAFDANGQALVGLNTCLS